MNDGNLSDTFESTICPECIHLRQEDLASVAVLYAEAEARKMKCALHRPSDQSFNPIRAHELAEAVFSLRMSRDDAHWSYIDHLVHQHPAAAGTPDAAKATTRGEITTEKD